MASTQYVVIVQLDALPDWLALDRASRDRVVGTHVRPVLAKYPECRVRWIDAEAFSGVCSDVLLVETADLVRWNHMWEAIRDTPLFAHPYFAVTAIIPGIEDGHDEYERTLAS